jgi:hypothetical protein
MLIEISSYLRLSPEWQSSIHCTVFEDNNGALLLANNHRLTNRTRYFHVDWHFFWDHQSQGWFVIVKVDTKLQRANIFTKGEPADAFEDQRWYILGWRR